jgi:hypothetical protein
VACEPSPTDSRRFIVSARPQAREPNYGEPASFDPFDAAPPQQPVNCRQPFQFFTQRENLPASAAVGDAARTATTARSSALGSAVRCSVAAKLAAALESAARCSVATELAALESTIIAESAAVAIVESTVTATVVAAAEPRAGACENSVVEVVRAVVAVRRASVRVVIVIAIGTDGLNTNLDDHLRLSRWR